MAENQAQTQTQPQQAPEVGMYFFSLRLSVVNSLIQLENVPLGPPSLFYLDLLATPHNRPLSQLPLLTMLPSLRLHSQQPRHLDQVQDCRPNLPECRPGCPRYAVSSFLTPLSPANETRMVSGGK